MVKGYPQMIHYCSECHLSSRSAHLKSKSHLHHVRKKRRAEETFEHQQGIGSELSSKVKCQRRAGTTPHTPGSELGVLEPGTQRNRDNERQISEES